MIPREGIKFDYNMGGGNILDLGTYPIKAVRQIMGAEPEECTACNVRIPPPPYELCDEAADMSFRFSGGRVADIVTDLRASVTTMPTFKISVLHNEVAMENRELPPAQTQSRVRRITLHNFLVAAMWHRIEIEDEILVRERQGGGIVKRSMQKHSKKVYTFKDAGIDQPSEPYWTSYRHQLEQFVNRIRGRDGSGLWVSNEDSLAQAKMIDMAYEKSGLPLRRTSEFQPAAIS
jgi:predicted dehydrogenase